MAAACGIVLDRHVPKNAGTTVRSMLMHNAQLRHCRYVGYDVSSTWRSISKGGAAFNHIALGELTRKVSPGTRWCIEAHIVSATFWPEVTALRSRCTTTVMVRVRQPLAWYRSYYSWAVLGKQRGGEMGYGVNFTHWLPNNLQSRMLLFGDAAGVRRWEQKQVDLRPRVPSTRSARLSPPQQSGLRRILRAADIVAPLERLDEALVLLNRLAGGWLDTRYERERPGPTHGPWEARRPQRRVDDVGSFCAPGERERACQRAVEEVAPDDHELYATASARFEQQVSARRADDPEFAKALDEKATARQRLNAPKRLPDRSKLSKLG
jgi:hypothetical protein